MLFFGSYWVFSAFKSYEYLHFYQISLLMLYAIGLALYLCEYIQYEHVNKAGTLSSSLEFGMCFLKIVRNSSIVLLLLLLSYGYRITKPTLSRRNILTLNVLLLTFFVVQSFYVAMQQRTNWDS